MARLPTSSMPSRSPRASREAVVALIGRQNVGKSTLFNTLVEEPRAVVSPVAGTTRDRTSARVRWRGRSWLMTDTGGIEERPSGTIGRAVRHQAERALRDADLLCVVVDGTAELTREDQLIAGLARASGKPVVVAVNKLDGPRARQHIPPDIARLGFATHVLVSAKNGVGTGDLLDAIADLLPSRNADDDDVDLALVLLGKPNVGKSSLVNRLLGEERVIVSEVPHTTRDPQDAVLAYRDKRIRLVDTAGMRKQAKRRARLGSGDDAMIEQSSVDRSLRLLHRADVAALILDVSQPVTVQDRHVAATIESAGTGLLIVVNKWDLVPDPNATPRGDVERRIRADLPFLSWAPLVFVSAATGRGVRQILDQALTIAEARRSTMSERSLERFLKHLVRVRKPPRVNNKPLRLVSLRQTGTKPPSFMLTVGTRQNMPPAYRRTLINELRAYYKLIGTGIRLRTESFRRR